MALTLRIELFLGIHTVLLKNMKTFSRIEKKENIK